MNSAQAMHDSSVNGKNSILDRPLPFIILGAATLVVAAWLFLGDSSDNRDNEQAAQLAGTVASQLKQPADQMRQVLQDEEILGLAGEVLTDAGRRDDLLRALNARIEGLHDMRVYGADVVLTPVAELGDSGVIFLDMFLGLATLPEALSPAQMVVEGERQFFARAAALKQEEEITGYTLLLLQSDVVLGRMGATLPATGYIALEQVAGGFRPRVLKSYGGLPDGVNMARRPVPGTLLRVAVPQFEQTSSVSNFQRILVLLLGALLLAWGLVRRQMAQRAAADAEPEEQALPSQFEPVTFEPAHWSAKSTGPGAESMPGTPTPTPPPEEPPLQLPPAHSEEGEIELSDIHYELESKQRPMMTDTHVELTSEIFRAYDIRGIVGETLDPGVAYMVGQAVGSLAIEQDATPVVVARDGRHSGPELVKGFIEGLNAAGCDAIDIGAAPTGVLYYAAFELESGSGVMITGSHNPPEYNGIKMLIGGRTLAGPEIFRLYERIREGDLKVGHGSTTQEDMLQRYIDRVAGDIQLARPLKVVADCGNGIGGAIAGDLLRAIGAEVLPLYDEVDGNFPNHHPDPSEPHNLSDVMEAVQLMGADLGVAFDGDADRLGVVTPRGEIIFPDRVMMLFIREILGRKPGGHIIYDVKCTGYLDTLIREAGGEPEMYKTGHSLIKNRMKEVDSPFAAEMSGHFFFEDRWYGFDCGLYTAARLLEILAASDEDPQDIFDALPNSVSTPELKVQMMEGENHSFITRFQDGAQFEGARVSTIDGLRADWEHGWGLVRASNTTPILVLRFDAESEEALSRVKEAFREQLLAIDPDLELPF